MIRALQARVILLAAIVGQSDVGHPTDALHVRGRRRPEAPLTQVAINFGTTTWLEQVSDEQYRAAAVK